MRDMSELDDFLDDDERDEKWEIYKGGVVIEMAKCIYDACDKAVYFGGKQFDVDYNTHTIHIKEVSE